jgi:CBS domain-containing protein
MSSATTPSASLLANLRSALSRFAPFAQMTPAHVNRFIVESEQAYYAPGETVLAPDMGAVTHLLLVRSGRITGRRGLAETAGGVEYEAGDLFPVGAVLGARAVTSHYQATEDCFCLRLPVAAANRLAADSAVFADFLNRRVLQYLELSRHAVQAAYTAKTLSEQSLEAPLSALVRKAPVAVLPETPLLQALSEMHERRIGSMIVADSDGNALGILTRHDILGRVTLPQLPLTTAIGAVMTTPVRTLSTTHTAQDAALLMSRHAVRHVPVTEGQRIVGIVSERDLFALQRMSLKQVSTSLRAAGDLLTLQLAANGIRSFAQHLLAQGVGARQLTELISHLNDVLTERLVELVAARRGLPLHGVCWVAFGSEGRSEQTISTDQDNGLVFASDDPQRDRSQWLDFALEVNEGLDACGYPLCKGNVMASNPQCCLTAEEWTDRFGHWLEHGAPEDLLKASIYFDLRPIAGNAALASPLREFISAQAQRVPRFIKQLADNALTHRSPLNWRGAIDTHDEEGRAVVDLKLQGTAIFVDMARVYALARGVAATGTRARLEAVGQALGIERQESEAWIGAFEFLQMQRLQVQLARSGEAGAAAPVNQNLVEVQALNDIDRRMLKESFRIARQLQQRLELDYQR